jgi:methylated-DNA-[protein]-cysteine S-methyltransferase
MGVTRHRGATRGASSKDARSGRDHDRRDEVSVSADEVAPPAGVAIVRLVAREDRGGRSAGAAGPDCVAHRYAVDGWGVGEIVTRDAVLVAHALPSRQRHLSPRTGGPQGGARPPEITLAADLSRRSNEFAPDLCRRFADHLAGISVAYDDVHVEEEGLTPFQRELLAAVRCVGWGEVVTYAGLAALAGRPRAARAAGSFCAGNRWSLVVPCHRVVAAGRDEPFEIGGYGSSGPALKRRLLALEGTLL